MKKITFLLLTILILASCSKENEPIEDLSSEFKEVELTQVIHYKNLQYEIQFTKNSNDELEPISKVPDVLLSLDDKEELATVIDGNNIYLFDDEKSKFDYYGRDYEAFKQSRIDNELGNFEKTNNLTSRAAIPLSISNFRYYALIYHHANFGGVRLGDRLTEWGQLKYLNSIRWDNEMSSIKIHHDFIYPRYGSWSYKQANRRQFFFYTRSKWRGRSLELHGDYWRLPYPNAYYYGTANMSNLLKGFLSLGNWNDKVSSIDIFENGRSLIH